MEDHKYILPQGRNINAGDCLKLLEAIKRGEVTEFDLKNEINAQWNKGYDGGCRDTKAQGGTEDWMTGI